MMVHEVEEAGNGCDNILVIFSAVQKKFGPLTAGV
jgi:hypothetical protein